MVDYERCVMRFPAQDIAHIGVGAAEPIAARAEVVGDPIPMRAVRLDGPSQQAGASQDIGGRVMPQVFGYALGRELLRHHLHQPTRAVGRHGQGIPWDSTRIMPAIGRRDPGFLGGQNLGQPEEDRIVDRRTRRHGGGCDVLIIPYHVAHIIRTATARRSCWAICAGFVRCRQSWGIRACSVHPTHDMLEICLPAEVALVRVAQPQGVAHCCHPDGGEGHR